MSRTRDWVLECLVETLADNELPAPEALDDDTALFGREGILDSVALVGLVLALEQRINRALGRSLKLATTRAMSRPESPFATVGALSTYADALVAEGD